MRDEKSFSYYLFRELTWHIQVDDLVFDNIQLYVILIIHRYTWLKLEISINWKCNIKVSLNDTSNFSEHELKTQSEYITVTNENMMECTALLKFYETLLYGWYT